MSWLVEAALALLLAASPVAAAGRAVTFHAADGRTVVGTLVEANRLPAPAVVLVPALGHSHDEWQAVAQALADAGITALTVDVASGTTTDSQDPAARTSPVKAAVTYLAGLPAVRASALGVAGASWGGSLAASEAAADPRVRALALVSPSVDYRGFRIDGAMRQYGQRPALFLASRRDSYAVRSARELTRDAAGPRETYLGDVVAHGVPLLAGEPELVRMFVDWFQRTLAVN